MPAHTQEFSRRRRDLLLGTGLMLAATPLLTASPARADIDPAIAPLRAVHSFHLGAMKVTMIDDARFTFPAPAFAANQPGGSIGPFLDKFGLPTDTVTAHLQTTLVETGNRKVLLDTGMGDLAFPGNDLDAGRTFAGLAAIGVTPDQITDVILSHGHPDHVGACAVKGVPCFENATYHMPPEELEFWTQKPGDEQNFLNFMLAAGNDKLEPVRAMIRSYHSGDEIVPGITAIAAPGHTLAHHAFMLANGGARLLHLVDVAVHYLVGPEEPDWALAVELDPDQAQATRRSLFKQAAEEKLLVAAYHFPFPGIGRIVEMENAWRFVPMATA